jgi:signal transduction histidine kinase
VLSEIFKPFFTTKFGGTGLGLTNVKHIAEAHGGSVLVESGEKGGTVFSVLLPAGVIHG